LDKKKKEISKKSLEKSMSDENWSGGNLQEEGFKLAIFTTTNLNSNNQSGVGMNNRTSVNFVRPSMKKDVHNDYSELILEEDEIESSENELKEEPMLGLTMKLKINNKSMVQEENDSETMFGLSNADSNLQYNNKYFEDLKEKKREVMYSNLTRYSIKKMVKKMEVNIMKKMDRQFHEV
jgi:hypothetical protein